MATLSESAWTGMRAASLTSRNVPTLRPEAENERRRYGDVTQVAVGVRVEQHWGRAGMSRSSARAGGRAKIEPMDARTAFGE